MISIQCSTPAKPAQKRKRKLPMDGASVKEELHQINTNESECRKKSGSAKTNRSAIRSALSDPARRQPITRICQAGNQRSGSVVRIVSPFSAPSCSKSVMAIGRIRTFSPAVSTACCRGMGKRREARERAVQFLFQHDLNPPEKLEEALAQFWNSQRAAAIAEEKGAATWGQEQELPEPTLDEAAMRLFAEPLIRGTLEHRDEVDEVIKKHAKNWELHRIAAVDRNILRLAIYEMLHRDDIPPVVSINEAVDIAKKFSTQDSGKFVNGILDKV